MLSLDMPREFVILIGVAGIVAVFGSMPFRVERDALPDGCRGAERVSWKVLQS
jgi:hypothetical protein